MKQTQRCLAALLLSLLMAATWLPPTRMVSAQTSANADVKLLPPALQARGQQMLAEPDAAKRATLARQLIRDEPVAVLDFMLAVLQSDTAPRVLQVVVEELSNRSQLAREPRLWQGLERIVQAHPNDQIALLALDKIRKRRMNDLRALLTQRTAAARQRNDEVALRKLAAEDERWISLVNGTMLPSFMRTPPPVFALRRNAASVRVLAFGDFGAGDGGENTLPGAPQQQVAAAMRKLQQQQPCDFGLTFGDNFYPVGMRSPTEARWRKFWDELYDPLGVEIYATLGNHDWGSADSPAAELLYARQSQSWRMPAPYYTFTAGPVQFFALDTNEVSEAQLHWLNDALANSHARWKLVYGHHPIYSAGQHGNGNALIVRLLPVLNGRADAFFAGHEHDQQHLKPEGGVHFFISGGGGAGIRPITPNPERSLFAQSAYGFITLEANADRLTVKYLGTSLETLYEYTLNKNDTTPGR